MSSWRQLVIDNPMLIEIKRFQRRFIGTGRSTSLNNAVLTLAAVCYAGLLLVVFQFKGSMPPIGMVQFQTGLFCLMIPAILHGAVAGERERRSWDLLLVAPISAAQIVVGKYLTAIAAVGAAAVLFLVPILTCGLSYERTSWYELFLAEGISLTFAFLVCSFSLFISCRARRAFGAMASSLGTLFTLLVLIPTIVQAASSGDPRSGDVILFLSPFVALSKATQASEIQPANGLDTTTNFAAFGWPHMIVYTILAIIVLLWAERTLRVADEEGSGSSRNKNA